MNQVHLRNWFYHALFDPAQLTAWLRQVSQHIMGRFLGIQAPTSIALAVVGNTAQLYPRQVLCGYPKKVESTHFAAFSCFISLHSV